jgi:hypothetical protein
MVEAGLYESPDGNFQCEYVGPGHWHLFDVRVANGGWSLPSLVAARKFVAERQAVDPADDDDEHGCGGGCSYCVYGPGAWGGPP